MKDGPQVRVHHTGVGTEGVVVGYHFKRHQVPAVEVYWVKTGHLGSSSFSDVSVHQREQLLVIHHDGGSPLLHRLKQATTTYAATENVDKLSDRLEGRQLLCHFRFVLLHDTTKRL